MHHASWPWLSGRLICVPGLRGTWMRALPGSLTRKGGKVGVSHYCLVYGSVDCSVPAGGKYAM